MNIRTSPLLLLAALLLSPLTALRAADASKTSDAPKAVEAAKAATAITPVPRKGLDKRHKAFVEIAKKGDIDMLFIGDSITDFWRDKGKAVWEKNYAPLKAANFGIWGDCTQHVLWRMQNGELDGIKPKVAVLMIGTNNLKGNKDEEIADGIKAIIEEIHSKTPSTKVLLLGIFPRAANANSPWRTRIKNVNAIIAKFDDGGKTVKYLDVGEKFLDASGALSKSIFPDALHPNEKGYEIWAEAIGPTVQEMMK